MASAGPGRGKSAAADWPGEIEPLAPPQRAWTAAGGTASLLHALSSKLKLLAVLATRLGYEAAEPSPRVCAVAGYLGSREQWANFAPRWEKAVTEAGVREFRREDLERGGGEFSGWGEEKRSQFLARLMAIIHESQLEALTSGLALEEFEALSPADKVSLTCGRPADPHVLCFNHCLVEAARRAASHPREEKVGIVFDWNDAIGSAALWHMEELKTLTSEAIRERLGALGFESRLEFPGLQAADLLVFDCFQRAGSDYQQRYRNVQ
jgi:hypothetical protein